MANKFANALKPAHSKKILRQPLSRKGTKHVGGYFSHEVSKQLKRIALEEDTSLQAILAEAIDMIFHSRKRPTIAQKTKD